MDLTVTYKYQSPISNDLNTLCCVCFYFVALDVSLGFHFLLCVCYVNPAYGCLIEINYELSPKIDYNILQKTEHLPQVHVLGK